MADKPVCQQSIAWLKHHFGSTHLAPLTGQDRRALLAFVHLLELYAVADGPGQKAAMLAMEATLHAMQPKTRQFARDAIPSVLDDSSDLWERLCPHKETQFT